jgi:hypothetical protein
MQSLTFSEANAKIRTLQTVPSLQPYLENRRKVYSFDLLSGWSCPAAKNCLAKVILTNDKRSVQDGVDTMYRCFSASQEAQYTSTYRMRKQNFDTLRQLSSSEMIDTLGAALPTNAGIIRAHVAGDFFNPAYFDAWCQLARLHPDRLMYAYTKSLNFWVSGRARVPDNLILTASYGGRHDSLIRSARLRSVRVIFNTSQAGRLEIDHDDSHAADPTRRRRSFALLLHGVQPKGTQAAAAVKALNGLGSYRRN